jgi:hypothetical protein
MRDAPLSILGSYKVVRTDDKATFGVVNTWMLLSVYQALPLIFL